MTAMPEPVLFEVATNPEPDSTLPFLIRLPLPTGELVLKARDSWPRTAKVYCHRADQWPEDPQIVERVAIRSCQRRGVAIDLVLDRPRENRSQLVFTRIARPEFFLVEAFSESGERQSGGFGSTGVASACRDRTSQRN